MQAGYYQATGGMVTQFNRLDVVSNNLANLNTTGYKRQDVVIGDFMQILTGMQDDLPYNNHTKEASSFINRTLDRVPQVVQEYTTFDMGSIVKTGNPLDVAIKAEDTFLAVQTPAGIKYTKAGSLSVNDAGDLVTKDGSIVISKTYKNDQQPIKISQDAQDIAIDTQGSISLRLAGTTTPETAGQIALFRFENPQTLKRIGSNLYEATQPPLEVENEGSLMQGYIEKSNVNPVNEMVALIEVNRLVGMYQKVMDTQMNDMNSDAINKLASIKV